VLAATYRRDLAEVLRARVLTPLQIGPAALTWRANAYRPKTLNGVARREFGSGIYASVDAMARVGLMAARGGRWRDKQILPAGYAKAMGRTPQGLAKLRPRNPEAFPAAPRHYGFLWWNNNDGAMAGVPRDAFWSWGKGESFILVVPSLDLVAARAGPAWKRGSWTADYDVLRPFFAGLTAAVAR
jgi:CubicO group peptidase (beta-lactamase class C family)